MKTTDPIIAIIVLVEKKSNQLLQLLAKPQFLLQFQLIAN